MYFLLCYNSTMNSIEKGQEAGVGKPRVRLVVAMGIRRQRQANQIPSECSLGTFRCFFLKRVEAQRTLQLGSSESRRQEFAQLMSNSSVPARRHHLEESGVKSGGYTAAESILVPKTVVRSESRDRIK